MNQSPLKKLCNFLLRKLDRAFFAVCKISDDRRDTKFIYKQSKKFFRQYYIYRAVIHAVRDLGPNDNLKLYTDSKPAQFLVEHELAYRISPTVPVVTPWFFKGDFLIIQRCHLKRIALATFDLFDSFFLTSGLKHFIKPPSDTNPNVPF